MILRALTVLAVALILPSLSETKEEAPAKAFLGATVRATTSNETAQGIVVVELIPKGPAETAGLLPGDIITKVDDKVLTTSNEFVKFIGEHKPGDEVMVHFTRGDKTGEFRVTLGERPKDQ
jgi:putative serine protease PepD